MSNTQSSPWNTSQRSDYWCLTGAIAMVGLALGSLLPLTSILLAHTGSSGSTIGMVIAIHALGLVCAILLGERSCRRYGARRTIEFFGVGAAVIACFMQGLTEPFIVAVLLFILGLFLGVVLNTVETWVNVAVPEGQRGRWLAIHCTIFTLFQLCGPILIQQLPAGHEYQLCGILMLMTWPIYRRLSPQKLNDEEDANGDSVSWYAYLFTAPVVVVSTALFALFDTMVLGLLPLYALAQGMDTSTALLSASVVLAGDTALEIIIGVLADRFGRVRVHTACATILLCSAVLLPTFIGTLFWWPALFVMGGAAGGIYVLSMMACGQKFKGNQLLRMTALLGSVWGVASIIGPLTTGAIMVKNMRWSVPVVVFSMAVLLLFALFLEQKKSQNSQEKLQKLKECSNA